MEGGGRGETSVTQKQLLQLERIEGRVDKKGSGKRAMGRGNRETCSSLYPSYLS